MSRNCFKRTSNKVISNENYNSKTLRTLNCEKTVYRNDQYGQCNSVNASVKIARTAYNTVINNVNNAPDVTFNIVPYIELSNQYIYEYLKQDIPISHIKMVHGEYYYKYSCVSDDFYIIDDLLYAKNKFVFG